EQQPERVAELARRGHQSGTVGGDAEGAGDQSEQRSAQVDVGDGDGAGQREHGDQRPGELRRTGGGRPGAGPAFGGSVLDHASLLGAENERTSWFVLRRTTIHLPRARTNHPVRMCRLRPWDTTPRPPRPASSKPPLGSSPSTASPEPGSTGS